MAAIGAKVADYVANQRQKDLIKCLEGVFGGLTSNSGAAFIDLSFDKSGQTALGPRQVAKARALLGDQGDKLTAVGMHSAVYYDLVERKAIDYVTNVPRHAAAALLLPPASLLCLLAASLALMAAITQCLPTWACASSFLMTWHLPAPTIRCISSPKALSPAVSKWVCRLKPIVTSSPRVMPCRSTCTTVYHPVGAKWTVGTTNPTQAALATIGNWTKVYETKNLGIVRATVTSNF
jgi:hypothetical protein